MEHNWEGRLGPITKAGRTVTKSIPLSSQNAQAALSARVFDRAYHILITMTLEFVSH